MKNYLLKILIIFSLIMGIISTTNAVYIVPCRINQSFWWFFVSLILINLKLIYFAVKKYKKS